MQKIPEHRIELQLVVEEIAVAFLVVHHVADFFVAYPRQIRIALLPVHVVKPEHGVIVVPGAVSDRAPCHVGGGAELAVAALSLYDIECIVQFIETHTAYYACYVSYSRHILPLLLFFTHQFYNT